MIHAVLESGDFGANPNAQTQPKTLIGDGAMRQRLGVFATIGSDVEPVAVHQRRVHGLHEFPFRQILLIGVLESPFFFVHNEPIIKSGAIPDKNEILKNY